ncbi:hypothetical protein LINPERHAP2_LOCUS6618 [Linum perenne]
MGVVAGCSLSGFFVPSGSLHQQQKTPPFSQVQKWGKQFTSQGPTSQAKKRVVKAAKYSLLNLEFGRTARICTGDKTKQNQHHHHYHHHHHQVSECIHITYQVKDRRRNGGSKSLKHKLTLLTHVELPRHVCRRLHQALSIAAASSQLSRYSVFGHGGDDIPVKKSSAVVVAT